MRHTIECSVELDVPVRTAYDQWTQFEEFPRFMSRVERVDQLDDRHLEWRTRAGGAEQTWRMEISEQIPDKRVAWTSLTGPRNAGVATFHRLAPDRSRVMVQLEYETEGLVQAACGALGFSKRGVDAELKAFKEFIESRGEATGAWRGEIASPDERRATV